MPKVVDVEERRALIAEACWRTIVRRGLAGVTTRALATEAGIGPGLLFHYFQDKEDILNASFELLQDRFRARLRDGMERASDSVERLRAMAYTNLPLDEGQRLEFGVWLSFWAHSSSGEPLRRGQQELYQGWREVLAAAVRDAIDDGLVRRDVDAAVAGMQLAALTDGLVVQIMLGAGHAEVAGLAVNAVDNLIRSWTTAPRRAARSTSKRTSA